MFKFFVFALACVASVRSQCNPTVTTASGTHAPSQICAGDLIFNEEFDTLDLKKWQHENTLGGGGNWEFQWYTNNRTNSWTNGGMLNIKPSLTEDHLGPGSVTSATLDLNGGSPADECTNPAWYGCVRTGTAANALNPVKSARLRTVNSFSFKYGRIDVMAKNPAGDWLWPAIWMMPRDNNYGGWPTSGEIDIMETRGNRDLVLNGVNIGTQQMGSTLHWGPDYKHNAYPQTHWEQNNGAGYNSAFHKYSVIWTTDSISFLVDDQQIGSVAPPAGGFWELGNFQSTGYSNPWIWGTKMAPFDSEFYIILNVAVGGVAFFPDGAANPGGKPWANGSPAASTDFWNGVNQWLPTWTLSNDDAALQIQYVKVFAL